jgi:hypothetical protein
MKFLLLPSGFGGKHLVKFDPIAITSILRTAG